MAADGGVACGIPMVNPGPEGEEAGPAALFQRVLARAAGDQRAPIRADQIHIEAHAGE